MQQCWPNATDIWGRLENIVIKTNKNDITNLKESMYEFIKNIIYQFILTVLSYIGRFYTYKLSVTMLSNFLPLLNSIFVFYFSSFKQFNQI